MNSVLAFHEVPDARWFDELVQWLQTQYRMLPAEYVSELYAGNNIRNSCHITVDDGHRSFYDVIFPVLQRRRVPATLFVSPRICAEGTNFWFQEIQACDQGAVRKAAAIVLGVPLESLSSFSIPSICKTMSIRDIESIIRQCRTAAYSSRAQNISVDELRTLAKSGLVTLGAHTMSHPILHNESDSQSETEIARSVGDLSALLQVDIRYFAYPNGLPEIDFSDREEGYLAAAGVELAFSTESRGVRANDEQYRVPRIQISANEDISRIRTKLRFANAWNVLKKLRPRGEYAERGRLNGMLRDLAQSRKTV